LTSSQVTYFFMPQSLESLRKSWELSRTARNNNPMESVRWPY